ncbi:competence-damaged protein-domain-containing protein [Chytriomyces sp. MP71]|nr:competence-damaged protein-domain-containing protein [Chytriomyces sp. MP71]
MNGRDPSNSTTHLAHTILQRLSSRGETLSTAESLTAGLVSAALTESPGSSIVLRAGIVAYSDEAKTGLLGVRREILQTVGPVSQECAEEMARGAIKVRLPPCGTSFTTLLHRAKNLQSCNTTWAIATTGFAGSISTHPPILAPVSRATLSTTPATADAAHLRASSAEQIPYSERPSPQPGHDDGLVYVCVAGPDGIGRVFLNSLYLLR